MENKIALYCSSLSFGGLEMNMVRTAKRMIERGNNVLFFMRADSPMNQFSSDHKIPTVPIEEHKKYLAFKQARKTAKLLRNNKITHMIVDATNDVAFASLIKGFFFRKLKIIYQQQMSIGVNKRDLIHTIRYARFDSWITPLPYLKEEAIQKTRINPDKISVIPLGIDTTKFINTSVTKGQSRKMLKLPEDRRIIGILGRIDPLKRQDFLIRAVQFLRRNNFDVDLLIMGEPSRNQDDNYPEFIGELIVECGVEDHVHIRPFSSDIIPFFKAIDIFAMTTEKETFGMVTVEAMANGVPVIACNGGGSIEILEHGKLGMLFDPNNLEDFAQKAIKIITQPKLEEFLKTEGPKTAVAKYDKNIECEGIENIIRNLS